VIKSKSSTCPSNFAGKTFLAGLAGWIASPTRAHIDTRRRMRRGEIRAGRFGRNGTGTTITRPRIGVAGKLGE
jgi:hypothetical protein